MAEPRTFWIGQKSFDLGWEQAFVAEFPHKDSLEGSIPVIEYSAFEAATDTIKDLRKLLDEYAKVGAQSFKERDAIAGELESVIAQRDEALIKWETECRIAIDEREEARAEFEELNLLYNEKHREADSLRAELAARKDSFSMDRHIELMNALTASQAEAASIYKMAEVHNEAARQLVESVKEIIRVSIGVNRTFMQIALAKYEAALEGK